METNNLINAIAIVAGLLVIVTVLTTIIVNRISKARKKKEMQKMLETPASVTMPFLELDDELKQKYKDAPHPDRPSPVQSHLSQQEEDVPLYAAQTAVFDWDDDVPGPESQDDEPLYAQQTAIMDYDLPEPYQQLKQQEGEIPSGHADVTVPVSSDIPLESLIDEHDAATVISEPDEAALQDSPAVSPPIPGIDEHKAATVVSPSVLEDEDGFQHIAPPNVQDQAMLLSEEDKFETGSVELIYQQFVHPVYSQASVQSFIPGLSVIDALFNCGFDSVRSFWAGC